MMNDLIEQISKIGSMAIFLVLFLLAHEWFRLRNKIDVNQSYSKSWHVMSWFIRLLVVGIIHQSYFNCYLTVVAIIMFFPVWNLVCNSALKVPWNYKSDHGIDAMLKLVYARIKKIFTK